MIKYKGETKVEEQKISFWKRIIISIKNIEQYQILAGESTKSAIKYLLKLMVVFTLVVAGAITINFNNAVNNFKTFIEQDVSELTFKDNELNVKSENKDETLITYKIEYMDIKIMFDTSEISQEKIDEYTNDIKLEFNGIIFLKDRIIIKNQMTNIPSTYNYSDITSQYNINIIQKQDIINALSNQNLFTICSIFFMTMFIYLYIIYLSSVLIDALVLALLGYITSAILKVRLKVSALYNIAVYALTLPIILNLMYIIINMFTGFTVKYFQIMYTAISYIYVISSILIIKSDVIKKQRELIKIMSEQEKVKEEIARKEQEKKEKEEKERIRKRDEEESKKEQKENTTKKKKEQGETDVGEQPEGTNA